MLELLAFIALGVAMGIVTGLLPGIHVNNLSPMLMALAVGSVFASMSLAAAIVAMTITNTFISYIPATFLGAPEPGTELSVLPAHRLLMQGKGYEAIKLTAIGCFGGLLLSAAMVWPMLLFIGPAYSAIRPQMHFLLAAVVIAMMALEKSKSGIFWAAAIFLLSGFLGLLSLDTNLIRGDVALMPLLSGLFGVSTLLLSLKNKGNMPEQRVDNGPLEMKRNLKPLIAGTAAGALTGIIPGIGPSQGTVLAQLATRSSGSREFIVSVSGVNTAKALFSFVALYAIGRARSGASVAVEQLMEVGFKELVFLVGIALFVGGIAVILHMKLGHFAARNIGRLPYRATCIAVIASIVGLTIYYSGLIGLLILAIATAIGILPAVVNVKRTHAMGVIMLPCILYFAGLKNGVLATLGL
jgi:putative membrane protein